MNWSEGIDYEGKELNIRQKIKLKSATDASLSLKALLGFWLITKAFLLCIKPFVKDVSFM